MHGQSYLQLFQEENQKESKKYSKTIIEGQLNKT